MSKTIAGLLSFAAAADAMSMMKHDPIYSIHPRNKRNHGMTASEIRAKRKRRKKEKAARKQRKRK